MDVPTPIRQSIILDIQAPNETASLDAYIKKLGDVEAAIKRIQAEAGRGINTPSIFSKTKDELDTLLKQLPIKGRTALQDVFKQLKVPQEYQDQLKRIAQKFSSELNNSFKLAPGTQTFQSSTGIAGAVQKIFSEFNREAERISRRGLTPASSMGKAGLSAGNIQAAIEGKIQLLIPARQVEAIIQGNVGIPAGGGGSRVRGRGPSIMSTYSWGGEGSTVYDRPRVSDLRQKTLKAGAAQLGSEVENYYDQQAQQLERIRKAEEKIDQRAASIQQSAQSHETKKRAAVMQLLKGGLSDLSSGAEQGISEQQSQQKRIQAAIHDDMMRRYNARLTAIKAEESAVVHRYQVERERMQILQGHDRLAAQAGIYGSMASDYERISKMPGIRPQDRVAYQRQAELLRTKASTASFQAENDPEHGSRWLNTGMKGLWPMGFAKNILTVTGWTAAVTAMYAPIQLATYSFQRMVDIGLQTQRLSQVFRGVGGDAQQLTGDLLKLAVATGRSTGEAMDAGIAWSRFGLSRKDVGEASRVSLVAANTANIPAELATERMSAIFTDYGLQVNQLSGALGMLEHTANTAKVQVRDLMDAVQVSGSAARQSGMSFAEFQGIVGATVERTSQTGKNIANAMKSVLGNIYNPEKQEKLRQDYGVEVLNKQGQLKPSEDIFRDMYVSYEKMSDTQKKLFSYDIAGKFQANRFIAIMTGYVRAQELAVTAQLNLNTAQEANAKIMESQHAQLQALRSEWDRYIVTTANRPGLGSFVMPGIGGALLGAIGGYARGGGPMGALMGAGRGFGIGAGIGGLGALTGGSSINQSLVDLEKFGTNLVSAGSGRLGSAVTDAFIGRMVGAQIGKAGILNGLGIRFGPTGAAIGALAGLMTGGQSGPRELLDIEKTARGQSPTGGIAGVFGNLLLHPIRTFNAAMDITADNPMMRFAEERNQRIQQIEGQQQAYLRASQTVSAVQSVMGMEGVSGKDKLEALKQLGAILSPGQHEQLVGMFNSGNMGGVSTALGQISQDDLGKARSTNSEKLKEINSALAQGEASLKTLREKDSWIDTHYTDMFGGQIPVPSGENPNASTEHAANLEKQRDLEAEIAKLKNQQNEYSQYGNDLEEESIQGLSQKMHNMQQLSQGLAENLGKLATMTPGTTPLGDLDRQTDLLKEQAQIYKDLSDQFRAMGQFSLGDQYRVRSFELTAMAERNQNPEYRSQIEQEANRQLAVTRYQQEFGNHAIGFTESEKMIARAKYDADVGYQSMRRNENMLEASKGVDNPEKMTDAINDEAVRAASAENDLHKTRIDLVTHYNELLAEQKQLQMDITREYQKSLLFAGPGNLLTKLSAARFKQRGVTSGDWFATGGDVRGELDTLFGGDRGRMIRREKGKIENYFGGHIPTVDQEQREQNTRFFPATMIPNKKAGEAPVVPTSPNNPSATSDLSAFAGKLSTIAKNEMEEFRNALSGLSVIIKNLMPSSSGKNPVNINPGHSLGSGGVLA